MATVAFEIHAAVIRQLIENQAGTLAKAVLEGVMNSIDALVDEHGTLWTDEPRVTVDIDYDGLVIRDNGRGFSSREEIERVFKVFGQPHVEGDAKFGRFRIGRGQLFAQGITVYRSGTYRMLVDYRGGGDEITYDFDDDVAHVDGVEVRIQFYADMAPKHGDLQRTIREIKEAILYLEDVEVLINGEKVNTGLADTTWSFEDDVAYYKLTSRHSYSGVQIYNQGVFVERISGYDWGCNGVVVSKAALPLNQARNQVRRSVQAWQQIANACREFAGRRARGKKTLSAQEIHATLRELAAHPYPEYGSDRFGPGGWQAAMEEYNRAWDGVAGMPIWRDVEGVCRSLASLRKIFTDESWARGADGLFRVAFADVGDTLGVDAQRGHRGLVLDSELLDIFACDDMGSDFVEKAFKRVLRNVENMIRVVPLEHLRADDESEFRTLPESAWKQREIWLIHAMHAVSWRLRNIFEREFGETWEPRHLVVGMGPALTWTDGATYIAFGRDFLAEPGQITPGTLSRLAAELVWSYCYDSPSTDGKMTTAEHHAMFSRLMRSSAAELSYEMWRSYVSQASKDGRKLPTDQLRRVQQLTETGEIELAYALWKDEDFLAFEREEDI